jgi:hypothetical protein
MNSAKTPKLSDKECLVAYIDIMGFASEIKQASNREQLLAAYDKIRFVQEAFLHPSASANPGETRRMNSSYGRRVIGLSDAVIVTLNPHIDMRTRMGLGDLIGLMFYHLALAQSECVSRGIFLRGGLAIGPFHCAKDILLSPALAHAYELESAGADNPVIVMPDFVRRGVDTAASFDPWEVPEQPARDYFRRYGNRKWHGERLFFLNYLGIMASEAEIGYSQKERDIISAASKARRYSLVDRVKQRSFNKGSALYLAHHRQTLEAAFTSAPSRRIKQKYLWLMKYHNSSFRKDILFVKDQVIDVPKF